MPDDDSLVIGGFTPMTTLDYPGELSAVIFCQGCPWRCRYCHNGDLIPRRAKNPVPWSEVVDFLEQRRGLLDAVVFSGGEPTLQKALPDAMREVKAMGYKLGLHTGGPYPDRLERLLPLVDWVGLDIKATVENYSDVTGVEGSGIKAWQSAKLLIKSGKAHEIRTTLHPSVTSDAERKAIARGLDELGPTCHRLQECTNEHCLDPELRVDQDQPSH